MKLKNLMKLNAMRLAVWGMLPAWLFGVFATPALWFERDAKLAAVLCLLLPVVAVVAVRRYRAAARIAFAELVWVFREVVGQDD